MILFTYHKGNFDCNGSAVLRTYLVGLLVVLGLIILSLCAIVYVSAQGKFSVHQYTNCFETVFPSVHMPLHLFTIQLRITKIMSTSILDIESIPV